MLPRHTLGKSSALLALGLVALLGLFSGVAVAQGDLTISFSNNADRSGAAPLDGSEHEGGAIFVFVTPLNQNQLPISRVQWFIDDAAMANAPIREDWSAPYDLMGGGDALDLSLLEPGLHTITAKLKIPGPDPVLQATYEIVVPESGRGRASTDRQLQHCVGLQRSR